MAQYSPKLCVLVITLWAYLCPAVSRVQNHMKVGFPKRFLEDVAVLHVTANVNGCHCFLYQQALLFTQESIASTTDTTIGHDGIVPRGNPNSIWKCPGRHDGRQGAFSRVRAWYRKIESAFVHPY